MPVLYSIAPAAIAQSQDINQLVNTLNGTQNTSISVKNTDPIAYTLQLENTDAAGKALLIYGPDGTTILARVQQNGMVASPDGSAAATIVTTSHTQTLTNKTLGTGTGFSGTMDFTSVELNLPNGTTFPTSPTPTSGSSFWRTDTHNLAVYDGTVWRAPNPMLNQLVNGGFEVWQRGNGPFTSGYTADRWLAFVAGTDTISVSKDTTNNTTPGAACAAVTFTLGTGGGTSRLQQDLKIADGYQLQGQTVTFSAAVRTNATNSVRLSIDMISGVDNFTYSPYHVGDNQYHTLSVTAPWVTGTTDVQCNLQFAASCNAYIDNAALVSGPIATDFRPLPPADNLARCLRYYYRYPSPGTGNVVAMGQAVSTTQAYLPLPIPAVMATAPTLTVSAVGDFALWNATGGPQTLTALTLPTTNALRSALLGTVASGLVAGNAATMVTLNATGWLALEANP